MRVLLVEDDRAVAEGLGLALSQSGHEVVHAASAEEALLHKECDVLVADLGLPGISGLELIAQVRARGEHPRMIVMTGSPHLEDCRRAMHLGAHDFLTKPFAMEELVRVVEAEPIQWPHREATQSRVYTVDEHTSDLAAREVGAYAMRCAVSPAARTRIATTCSELVDNVERHAYPDARGGQVRVSVTLDQRQLRLTVEDDGAGFDPLAEDLDHLSDCRAGGLARASCLAEDMAIESAPGAGARIVARFQVARALFDEEEQVDLSELDFLTPDVTRQVLAACHDDPDGASRFVLSPALAVSLGRLLAGPDPRRVLRTALWS